MAQPDGSIRVKPGVDPDPEVLTLLVNGKHAGAVVLVNELGQMIGDIPTYSAWSGVIAAAANKVYWHLFNAAGSGKIVKVRKLFIQPSLAVNALAAQTWRVAQTSAVGTTGNTGITIRKHDSVSPAVPAQITAAHSYTAGGTEAFTYFEIPVSVEETLPAVGIVPWFNVLPVDGERVQDYVLNEGQGLALKNITGGAYSYSALGVFSIE